MESLQYELLQLNDLLKVRHVFDSFDVICDVRNLFDFRGDKEGSKGDFFGYEIDGCLSLEEFLEVLDGDGPYVKGVAKRLTDLVDHIYAGVDMSGFVSSCGDVFVDFSEFLVGY